VSENCSGLSCGIVCMYLLFSFVETDRQTHDNGICHTSIASCGNSRPKGLTVYHREVGVLVAANILKSVICYLSMICLCDMRTAVIRVSIGP